MLSALRQMALDHYGRMCHCPGCGETRLDRLEFDHVEGAGNRHRRVLNGRKIEAVLRAAGYPTTLTVGDVTIHIRLLCRPCNQSKGAGATSRCRLNHTEALMFENNEILRTVTNTDDGDDEKHLMPTRLIKYAAPSPTPSPRSKKSPARPQTNWRMDPNIKAAIETEALQRGIGAGALMEEIWTGGFERMTHMLTALRQDVQMLTDQVTSLARLVPSGVTPPQGSVPAAPIPAVDVPGDGEEKRPWWHRKGPA